MNISEFAEAAGVSKSAVSRYFNKGYLSEDKRKKIEKAIEETGYSPSISARTMRTKVTKLVGVILPKLSSESCSRITEGISRVLDREGYQILLVNTANDYGKEIEYLELFRQNRVDGVILLASVFTPYHKAVLNKMHIPVIIVGQHFKGYSCVCHDDFGAAYALTELMLKKGAFKAGCIAVTDEDVSAGKERREGFLKAIADNGAEVSQKHIAVSEFTMESGYEQAKRILSRGSEPDCIFCATDSIALGAMLYCREKGISVPNDIMLCGIGDTRIGELAAVPLTTARLHYHTAGVEAAEMLLNSLKNENSVPKILRLDYEIKERGSTKR